MFGSQARGEAQENSDIDILIVLKDSFNDYQKSQKISSFISDLCLEYDVVITCFFATQEKWKTHNYMLPEQEKLIEKARKSPAAAKQLNDADYPEFAISRAYYTIFYLAFAFLEGDKLGFSKHSAVISAFGKYFVKTGRIPSKYHRYLIDAEKARCSVDYNTDVNFSDVEVQEYIKQGEDFLNLSIKMIDSL